MKTTTLFTLFICFCALMATERPAHAYLDPGVGSYTAQVLFAGLFVGAVSLRLTLRKAVGRICSILKRR